MARVIRNIFLILFAFVVCFNFLYIIFAYSGSGWFENGLERYFLPSRDNFFGFEHWFSKLETYPGIQNILHVVKETADRFQINNDPLTTISAIISLFVVPLKVLIAIIVDIVNNIVWFFNLLDPYHNFIGF